MRLLMYRIETYGYHGRKQYECWDQVAQAAEVEYAIQVALMYDVPVKVWDSESNLILERGMDHDKTRL